MTNQQHPFNPPTELVRQWIRECDNPEKPRWQEYEQDIATRAAQWGWNKRGTINEAQLQERADVELEACCEWLRGDYDWGLAAALRLDAERRPEPPSETEQALETLNWIEAEASYDKPMFDTIRRALERLKKMEQLNDSH